jgi:hypothetical protein
LRTIFEALSCACLCLAPDCPAQDIADPRTLDAIRRPARAPYRAPDLRPMARPEADGLGEIVMRYSADAGALARFYDVPYLAEGDRALRDFYTSWLAALDKLNIEPLGAQARIDYLLLRNRALRGLRQLDAERRRFEEMRSLIPFADLILGYYMGRQKVDPLDPAKAAGDTVHLEKQVKELIKWVEGGAKKDGPAIPKTVARRAARAVESLRETWKDWFRFYSGYDPLFGWWMGDPYKQADSSLGRYAEAVREKLAGLRKDDRDTILGDPVGREALREDLASEFVTYSPEELIEIAQTELAWCDNEMRKAARDLGHGDDWKRALEHVKTLHVAPGRQPALILALALEAVEFIEQRNLITVPPLARDSWRMTMMTPERQRVNPFFTGGEVISVSFPTDGMSHEQKMMSMRGNNIHFSRSTVFHELIPGHYLQRFQNERNRPYRQAFSTAFWTEGWAFYWEMLLWDSGFPKTPENRIGMLFWRMHRAARILFSLNFHLGKMTAGECVDFLVNRVGHERENAAAEVRRSFETNYAPLYQSAYMLGALQFYALHKEMTTAGKMSDRNFHDAVMQWNSIPVEMVRAALKQERLPRDYSARWRFYGGPAAAQ